MQEGAPVPFRYGITPKQKVNTFEPKIPSEPPSRASMLGAVMCKHFNEYPLAGEMTRVLWEAGLQVAIFIVVFGTFSFRRS